MLSHKDCLRIISELGHTADDMPVTGTSRLFFWVDGAGYVARPGTNDRRVTLIETTAKDFHTTDATGGEYPYGVDVENCYSSRYTAELAKK